MSVDNFTICSVASPDYLPYLRALVLSAKKNFSAAKIAVELINCKKEDGEEFYLNHPNISVYYCNTKYKKIAPTKDKTARKTLKDVAEGKEQQWMFCTNRKCYFMQQCRRNTKDTIMFLDSDSLIRKPVVSLDLISGKDMVVKIREPIVKRPEVMSCMFTFGNSDRAIRLLDQYVDMTEKDTHYAACQDHLATIYMAEKDDKVISLPSIFIGFKAHEDKMVYALKCKPKELNGVFQSIKDKYLEEWKTK